MPFSQPHAAARCVVVGPRRAGGQPCRKRSRFAVLSLLLAASGSQAGEGDSASSELSGAVSGTLTLATMIRTAAPAADSLGQSAPARLGLPPGNLQGNAGGADLNFAKNRPVSTVLKAVLDFRVQRGDSGVFARARLWHDAELRNGDRAYGNSLNGFRSNVPLSDSGYDPANRFSAALWAESYVYTRQSWQERTLDLRFGRQTIRWGVSNWLDSGINSLNPTDFAALTRPGLLADREGQVPLGMLTAKFSAGSDWSLSAALPYEFRGNVQAGCGTFLAQNTATATGCNYAAVLAGLDDATAYSSGLYAHRGSDTPARNGGQFGLTGSYRLAALDTELSAYWLNYHSRAGMTRGSNANINGGYGTVVSRLTDPHGVRYGLMFPEGIRLYGLSADYRPSPQQRLYGEFSYRPNQPLQLTGSDLVAAFVGRAPNSLLNLAKGTNALPPGASFDNYDRYPVTTLTVGGHWLLPSPWAAAPLLLAAEAGTSLVSGLPDPGVLRYGRADEYGVAAINGQPCVDPSPAQKACSHEGFVTSRAWGYRLRLQSRIAGSALGARWLPALFFAHDVRGYAFDGSFLEGRKILRPSLRAEWGKDYFAEASYTRLFAAPYFLLADRSHATFTLGANF